MKGGPRRGLGRGIVRAQPVDEIAHLVVAPHPGWETGKRRPFGGRIFEMPNIMVDARGIRPIAFDGDEAESLLDDQFARDALAHPIEFRGAMRRFAEQHDARVADSFAAADQDRPCRSSRTVRLASAIVLISISSLAAIVCRRAANAGRRSPSSGAHPSSPSSGTNRTSARSSRRYSFCEIRVTRTSSCARWSAPTGITSRPPIFSWSFKDSGTVGPPAATMIAS